VIRADTLLVCFSVRRCWHSSSHSLIQWEHPLITLMGTRTWHHAYPAAVCLQPYCKLSVTEHKMLGFGFSCPSPLQCINHQCLQRIFCCRI